jgi:hypothetical protein
MHGIMVLAALLSAAASSAYAQGNQDYLQGGDYSGFNESGEQPYGLPNQQANPTPQAPISDLEVQEPNKTDTTTSAVDDIGQNPAGMAAIIGGLGALAAGGIVAVAWIRKKGKAG